MKLILIGYIAIMSFYLGCIVGGKVYTKILKNDGTVCAEIK